MIDIKLNLKAKIVDENGFNGVPVRGFNNGDEVIITKLRVLDDSSVVFFISGTIHAYLPGSFRIEA
jgi:hypothetical protein